MTASLRFIKLSDGKLHTEDGSIFHIYKIALAKASEYFRCLFCGPSGKGKEDYLIPGIRGEILGVILSFVGKRIVDITDSNVYELLIAADYLLLEDLIVEIKKVCLTITNCLPIFLAALKIDRKDIVLECFRFILTHFESVAADDGSWLSQLPHQVLEQFLGHRSLCVRDEAVSWKVARKWVEADVENRNHLLPGLLKHVAVFDPNPARFLDHITEASNPNCGVEPNSFIDLAGSHGAQGYAVVKQPQQASLGTSAMDDIKQWMTSFWIPSFVSAWIPPWASPSPYTLISSHRTSHVPFVCTKRRPPYLYFIAEYFKHIHAQEMHIYATYDGEIDLWRKIVNIDEWTDSFFVCGQDIYMQLETDGIIKRYSLREKEFKPLPKPRIHRKYLSILVLDGLLYAMGGVCPRTGRNMSEVEVYSRQENQWHKLSPMFPVFCFSSTTMGGKIYVIGKAHENASVMVAQSYCPETDAWTLLPPPSVVRDSVVLVCYKGQLYVLGGETNDDDAICDSKEVEVFDPMQRQWFAHASLPPDLESVKATVLHDRLIVHEDHHQIPELKPQAAWMWNEEQKCWNPIGESSPLTEIYRYSFMLTEDEECVKLMTYENRDPETKFTKSLFSKVFHS